MDEKRVSVAPPFSSHNIDVRSDETAQEVLHALEWTRTTTGKTPHKALNPIRPPLIGPAASRSSNLWAFADASDGSGGATFVRASSRAAAGSGSEQGCPCGRRPQGRRT